MSNSILNTRQRNPLEPLFDILQLSNRDRIDVDHWALKVFKHKDQVKVFQAELNALEVGNLNVCESNDEEREFGELDETVGCGLEVGELAVRDTLETELAEGNVNVTLAFAL